jgi:hypothetical protein
MYFPVTNKPIRRHTKPSIMRGKKCHSAKSADAPNKRMAIKQETQKDTTLTIVNIANGKRKERSEFFISKVCGYNIALFVLVMKMVLDSEWLG